jgi:hypothetical protein
LRVKGFRVKRVQDAKGKRVTSGCVRVRVRARVRG